jgi:peroxiredoxin
MEMLMVLAWLIVAIGCWVGYQLVRQNGRILLQLESLEKQLAEFKLPAAPPAPAPPAMPAGLPVGMPAPAFELPDLSNQQHSLAEWRGRRLLLIFFNPGCGFCRQMAADIAALPLEDQDKPMPLLVSTGSAEDNRKLMQEHGIHAPVLLQKQMEVASQYRVNGTPIGYLVDAEGRIASEMATGATALLELAAQEQGEAAHAGQAAPKVGHELTNSKIKRDGLPAGTPAPAFQLPRLGGGELGLDDFRGRKLLLLFSDPGCGPCQQLSARLSEAWSPQSPVQILMVSRGSVEANQAKVKEHKLAFPIVLQKQWEISKLYAMFATPIAYLIDEQGIIVRDVAVGADAILALLAGARSPVIHEVARTA